MPKHYTAEDVAERLAHPLAQRQGFATTTIDLRRGETAWNPASTKGRIHAPARVIYEQFADGGVNVRVA